MSDSRTLILTQLSDGEFHTGTSLAMQLGISRAAVWKHIQHLRQQGVPIGSVHGKGYCLDHELEFLERDTILQYMPPRITSQVVLEVLPLVSSTNDWLGQLRTAGVSPGQVCLAEQQTTGRGTQGRQWQSPLAANLYLSFYWRFRQSPMELGGLSLAIAVSVVEQLAAIGVNGLSIKWPNDIYLGQGKAGGILVDISGETTGPSDLIIGIGLNYNMPVTVRKQIDQQVADISDDKVGSQIGRNQLAAIVIEAIFDSCTRFAAKGFAGFYERWTRWDRVFDRPVSLSLGNHLIEGIAQGVDENGSICLSTDSGRRCYASGEVSLRERGTIHDQFVD